MPTIHKYDLMDTVKLNAVKLPSHARLLSVGYQKAQLVVWALVDPTNHTASRSIAIRTTGEDVHGFSGNYIGTATRPDGFVVHVFDLGQ